MGKFEELNFLQVILQKSKAGQVEIGRKIKDLKKKGDPFIFFDTRTKTK